MPVQQGKIMNATEADGEKVNPNYDKKNSDELGYRHNCQTCTMAYELRRRGFDVEAMPNPKLSDGINREFEVTNAVIGGWLYRYLNKDGTPASYVSSGIGYIKDTFSHKLNYINSVIDEAGRYEIKVKWKNRNCWHVFIIEKTKKGDTFWYDPQTGRKRSYFRSYIKDMEADDIVITRIDDKLINVKLASWFRKKAKKRTNKKKTK